MSSEQITRGAIGRILNNEVDPKAYNPVVQVIDVRRIASANGGGAGQDRFRLVVSDSEHFSQCMAASQLNQLINDSALKDGCMVKLENYLVNKVQGRGIIIVLGITVLSEAMDRIGEPTAYPAGGGAPAPAVPAPTPTLRVPTAAAAAPTNNPPSFGGSAQSNAQQQQKPYVSKPDSGRQQQQQQARGGQGGGGEPIRDLRRICEINPYLQRFTLKARVVSKGPMRSWDKTATGGTVGCLFSMDLSDASGEIRATLFKEVAEKFFAEIQEGKLYVITETGARVKSANKQYSSLDNEHEVTLQHVTFTEHPEDGSVPRLPGCNWVKIGILAGADAPPPDATLDTLAVIKDFLPVAQLMSKKGNELTKREITLVDDSGYEVRVTIWGDMANKPDSDFEGNPVAAFKGLKVSDFGGVSLSVGFSGSVVWDAGESMPEGAAVRDWWLNGGDRSPSVALTTSGGGGGGGGGFGMAPFAERIEIDAIKSQQLGFGEKPDYATFKGTINFLKGDRMWYEACSQEGCQKKVASNTDGSWQCEKCNTSMANCERRYMCSMTFADESGQAWVSSFNETSLTLFDNMTADELASYKEELGGEEGAFEDFLKFKYTYNRFLIKVRVKNEVWSEQSRVKCTVANVTKLNYADESRSLIDALNNLP